MARKSVTDAGSTDGPCPVPGRAARLWGVGAIQMNLHAGRGVGLAFEIGALRSFKDRKHAVFVLPNTMPGQAAMAHHKVDRV